MTFQLTSLFWLLVSSTTLSLSVYSYSSTITAFPITRSIKSRYDVTAARLNNRKQPLIVRFMSNRSGKGFGKTSNSKKSNNNKNPSSSTSSGQTQIQPPQQQEIVGGVDLSGGQKELARLRRAQAEKRNEELESMRKLRSIDSELQSNPSAATIPEKVAQRMTKRMIPFVGLPLFTVLATFVGFWYLATYGDLELQPTVVAYSTIAILIASLLGITYSVMSASWDPDVEGSALGVDEFQTNVNNIKEGLQRSTQNARLRDRMNTLSEKERRELDRYDG